MAAWVNIVDMDADDEPMEVQTEPDGTLLLTTITTQFPGTIGLKFKNPETGGFRGIRCKDNVLYPPNEDGWDSITFICTKPKVASKSDEPPTKRAKVDEASVDSDKGDSTNDLIVLGLPFSTTEAELKEFFEKFGPLTLASVKKNNSGSSKGFGFIRFETMEAQKQSMLTRHMMSGRWVDVKVPESLEKKGAVNEGIYKVFVGRIDDTLTKEDLSEHFSQFGKVTDIFWPRPMRGFAFVSFLESKVAQSLLNKDHLIKGVSVHIGLPDSKKRPSDSFGGGGGGGGGPPHADKWGGNRGDPAPWGNSGGGRSDEWQDRRDSYGGGPRGGGGGRSQGSYY
eukprot:snap_masked-scaffold714_size108203-processed-gene-0.5 protein:Tk02387 transcript:snap_masked-scaffold714_size108203-processed-gene-0.5-mRNA-1 annotation:"tar dna-binding protein 43-like isoform x2"